jgi:retron-type reverse transcriptase
MNRHNNLWEKLVSFNNIFKAFKNAVKGKGLKPYVLNFIKDLEQNLFQIQNELIKKNYVPGFYRTFIIYEPKKRMISEAPFKDRIVHHCLMNIIGPIFERTFISQSYANRIGKGTHRAIRNVQNAMRLNTYILHCDIRKYFACIDHQILKSIIRRKIKDRDVLWLIDIIIDNSNPQEDVVDYFPGDNLFSPFEHRKGLPIGNLTSQWFANIYLNGLDHFIKEKLRCRYYARYVDDIVVAHSDKEFLWNVCTEIEKYLEKLRLRIHPHKCHIRPMSRGVRFLGQVIYPDKRLLPKSNIRRFMRRMKRFQNKYQKSEMSFKEINHSVQSWLGHAKQANTYALRENIFDKIVFTKSSQV